MWKKNWKRPAVVLAVLVLVGASVYLNWRYAGNVAETDKILGQIGVVGRLAALLQHVAGQALLFVEFEHAEQVALVVEPAAGLVERGGQGVQRRADLFFVGGQQGLLADQGDLLVDARAAERFRGEVEPIDRVAGHVPGANNRPYASNLSEGRFKPAGQLAQEFAALLDGRDPQRLIAMCGSGVTACHHLLAMTHAGLPGARLFTGSWSGWIEDPARPIATGD